MDIDKLWDHKCDNDLTCKICIAYNDNLIPNGDGLYRYEEENEEFMRVHYQSYEILRA